MIGTTAPVAALHVNGDIKASNTGGMRKIVDVSINGVTSYTVTGLNGDSDMIYYITIDGRAVETYDTWILMTPNNATTDVFHTNDVRSAQTNGTNTNAVAPVTLNGTGFSLGAIGWGTTGDYLANFTFYAASGRNRMVTGSWISTPTGSDYSHNGTFGGVWRNTTSNVTSLVFTFPAGGFTGQIVIFALRNAP